MKNIFIAGLISIILITACVGPEEPDYGLIDNFPVVVNTRDAFTFNLFAEEYNFEESYKIALDLDSAEVILINLIVTGFQGSSTDTSEIELILENNATLELFDITENTFIVKEHINDIDNPLQTMDIFTQNYNGQVELVITGKSVPDQE